MGLVTDLPPGVPQPPQLKDVAWLLADLDTGKVVAAKAPHARLLPASTLKTLTALTLIPRVPPTTRVVAAQEDAQADGTRVGIVPGLPYSAGQLFEALLMSSGNDAAYALARAGGGREKVLAEMNERAAYLGAHDTVAKDPSGLDAPGQTSSAYDLALIGRAALQLKDFRTYVTTKQARFPGKVNPRTKKRASYVINNHNRLLYNYAGTIGVKNGYTTAAKRTFISAVHRGTKTYMLTEMYGLDPSWHTQAAMYDWAFRYGSRVRPVGDLVAPGTMTTAPRPVPSPTAPSLQSPGASPAEPTKAPTAPRAAAAALPVSELLDSSATPWVGLGGLAAALLLVGAFGLRVASRRSRHAPRH
jgi:D-alanyl-D-alanine carboxypeptidase (penicillin-binding protein 5/6)